MKNLKQSFFLLFLILSTSSTANIFAAKIYLDKDSVQLLDNMILVTTENGPMIARALRADKKGIYVDSLKPLNDKSYCSEHGHFKNNRNGDCDRCERDRERPWEREIK